MTVKSCMLQVFFFSFGRQKGSRWPAVLAAPQESLSFHLQVDGSIPTWPAEIHHAFLEPTQPVCLPAQGNMVGNKLSLLDLNI